MALGSNPQPRTSQDGEVGKAAKSTHIPHSSHPLWSTTLQWAAVCSAGQQEEQHHSVLTKGKQAREVKLVPEVSLSPPCNTRIPPRFQVDDGS